MSVAARRAILQLTEDPPGWVFERLQVWLSQHHGALAAAGALAGLAAAATARRGR